MIQHLTYRILGFELATSVARTPLTLPESHFESKSGINSRNFVRRPQPCIGQGRAERALKRGYPAAAKQQFKVASRCQAHKSLDLAPAPPSRPGRSDFEPNYSRERTQDKTRQPAQPSMGCPLLKVKQTFGARPTKSQIDPTETRAAPASCSARAKPLPGFALVSTYRPMAVVKEP